MRIAIICKTLLKGGAEKQALILTKLLSDKGIDVLLINWYGEKIDPENLNYVKTNSFNYYALKGSFLRKFFHFMKIIRQEGITITVSYLTLSNFVSGLSKVFNREIISIGGIRNERLPFHKFIFEKLIHNYLNNATVFNNYSAKNKFEKRGFKVEKIYVIQNAIDFNELLASKKPPNGEIKIITVGRFVKQKDYNTSLISFRDLINRQKDKVFKYKIVGYGPLEGEIRSLVENLKIDQNVELFINPPNITAILENSDIFLSTSLFEGVSNSILEAMVSGLPIVATDVGDNKFLIKDGKNGFLVPCKNVDQIVEKLEYLSTSEDIRREFGNNSRQVLKNEFSKAKLLDQYLKLFSSLQQ